MGLSPPVHPAAAGLPLWIDLPKIGKDVRSGSCEALVRKWCLGRPEMQAMVRLRADVGGNDDAFECFVEA